jgi:UDP-glucose 4-epimerase
MRVAITGASGYVGRHLLRRLIEEGHGVSALSRSPLEPSFSSKSFQSVLGDIRNQDSLRVLVQDSDAVVHLAAYVHKNPGTEEEKQNCFDVNVEGTRRLLREIEKTGRVQRIIYISTIAVYGSAFEMVNEDSACSPITPYASSKLEAEKLILEAFRKGFVTGFILRTAMVCGVNAPGNLQRIIGLMRVGVFPLVEKGKNKKSLVSLQDLVELITQSLKSPAQPRVYNIASDPPLTILQISEALKRGLGKSMIYVPVSAAFVDFARRLNYRGFQSFALRMEAFASTTTVDNSAIRGQFHYQFERPDEILTHIAATSRRVA